MKSLCRAALVAFALTLALAPAAQSKRPVSSLGACHDGKPCKTHDDCGKCTRCGYFCDAGACVCG